MKKAIIITAALVMPTSVFAQGADAKPKAPAKKAAQAKKPENPGMAFIGQDGKIVDMKKDKCWNPNDRPYRAPGWC